MMKICIGRYDCPEINAFGEYPFNDLVEFEIAVGDHCEQCEAINNPIPGKEVKEANNG
jgi:hypothetical protein